MSGKLTNNPSVGSLERALRDLQRDVDGLRADVFTNPKPMRATLDMGGNRIVNVGKPIDLRDAETKAGRAASGVSTFAKSGSAGLTGAVTISGGTNVTLTQTGQDVSIAATGGGDALVANPLSQFAATTSAQLAGVISDETGTGALVFGTAPTIATPTFSGASAIPAATNTTDLGGPTRRFKDLFMAGILYNGSGHALTLPATGNDTLANLAGAQSLTNKKLGSLTTNGFVKTSGGDGTLSVDTATYLTSAAAAAAYQPLDANLTTWAGKTAPSGTVLGNTDIQSVGSKKFDDASCSFMDDGDNTKLMRFQCSGITTATTRTLTVPDASGTIALTADLAAYQPLDADLTSWASVTRAAGFDTFAATPSSANLAAALTDETGTGAAVFATAPTLVGEVIITYTATENDSDSVEIVTNAAGYGDVKALDIDYITGAISAGEGEAVILVNIDELASTGGAVFGLEVLATEGGATIYGMKAGALVGPILQESGTFANPTTGTNDTASTDVPAMIDGDTGTTTTIFVADDDYIIIGGAAAFTEIEIVLQTVANASITPTFGYSITGSGQFTAFSPVDGTNGFRNTGIIAWDATDLTGHTTNNDTGTYDIKITRTKNANQTVVLYYAKTAETVVYKWDVSGNVTVNTVELGTGGDTTIARSGAGDITIEGNVVYRAGGTDVPVADGGTGRSTSTTAYGLIAAGTTATGAHQTLAAGATTDVLVGGGASALPVWTAATGSGAPVRATSPTLVTPVLGAATGTSLNLSASLTVGHGSQVSFGGAFPWYATDAGGAGALVFGRTATNHFGMSTTAFYPITGGGKTLGTATLGWDGLFLDEAGAGTETAQIIAPTLSGNIVLTTPSATGTLARTDGDAIGSTTPAAGAFTTLHYSRTVNATLSNGANNDVANPGTSYWRLDAGPTAAFSITGIVPANDGQLLIINNRITQNMTIANASASSALVNRIYTSTGADVATVGQGVATLIYDSTVGGVGGWILTAIAQ